MACASITRIYGFYDAVWLQLAECKRRYNIKLWKQFCDVFNCMSVCAVIDEKIVCMHGGLSPEITSFEQVKRIVRPTDVPDTGLICDLLWADPDKDIQGWAENDRGVSFIFGPDVVSNFLQKQEMDLVCRAHQVVEDGYEFFAKRQLITLFSAPNYCGEFDNAGAMMSIDETLMCSFKEGAAAAGVVTRSRADRGAAGALAQDFTIALPQAFTWTDWAVLLAWLARRMVIRARLVKRTETHGTMKKQEDLAIEEIIEKCLEVKGGKPGKLVQIPEGQVKSLCTTARMIFLDQSPLLELEAPLKICGDVHGQYHDLLRLFEYGGFPPESNYLFLGDYVDRGKQSLETITLLFAYKVKFPENFFLLRGNHECASITRIYGFYDECKRRYNIKLWKQFCDVFNCMPVCGVIDEKIVCMHGGLSPEITNFDQVKRIVRPTDVPDTGLICDLLWADPDKEIAGWAENDRGVSFIFGPDVVSTFLQKHEMDLVCRAHQVVEDGYEFFAKRQLITLFSAPNYCGEFDNAGAMMSIDETLMCSFKVLKPVKKK
ncbi:unnamed protein product [Effrenium voratum]|uniref:Serine/threonine-protein phosphatase n=1 Tax=Effrenium voratum TaxID=2562239 RepID=A0AA36N7B3_9DINO|nr:unnamed protein product [Effrenium voratum]